jgi:hypothetical protein
MKQLIFIMAFALNINAYGQEDKTVTLVTTGQGETKDEAKKNALRNAIEQAFGAYISTKTEILNDELVKDEIVSVANGNIQKFEIISEVKIPDGGYATTLQATVSVTKLTSFAQEKGIKVEIKGGLFAANLIQQELNEKNETAAIEDLMEIVNSYNNLYSYILKVADQPVMLQDNSQNYSIGIDVNIKTNESFNDLSLYVSKCLQSLSLNKAEAENLQKIGKQIYPVSIGELQSLDGKNNSFYIMLRSENSLNNVHKIFTDIFYKSKKFDVASNLGKVDKEKGITFTDRYGKVTDHWKVFIDQSIHRGDIPGDNSVYYKKVPLLYTINLPNDGTDMYNRIKNSRHEVVCVGILGNRFIENNFPFVKNLKNLMIVNEVKYPVFPNYNFKKVDPGLIVSFKSIQNDTGFLSITLEDVKSMEELQKLTEYKVVKN